MLQGRRVEAELDDVAVLDGVFFAFHAELPGRAGFGLGAEVDEIVEGDGFGGEGPRLQPGAGERGRANWRRRALWRSSQAGWGRSRLTRVSEKSRVSATAFLARSTA